MFSLRGGNVEAELKHKEYERIIKWIQQLNAEFDNKEVTHSQLLEEARKIGVAVMGWCAGIVIKGKS